MDYLTRNPQSPFIYPPRPHAQAGQNMPLSAAGYGLQLAGSSARDTSPSAHDVVFLVGKRRHAYHVKAESLIRGSAYFRNLLQKKGNAIRAQTGGPPVWPSPLEMDCEEGIFESLLLLMSYGTFAALPPMSSAEAYQLKREADFYGITYSCATPRHSSSADSGMSDVSCTSSSSSGSPKSPTMNMSPPPTPPAGKCRRQLHEGVRVSCSTPRQGLAELPEFPLDLADPARLVLVSRLDADEAAKFYRCTCSTAGSGATQWALNFHHRHAFCTACGAAPPPLMSAKHFSDMFMAAAAFYSTEQGGAGAAGSAKWRVKIDSTCLLRFVSSAGSGPDACGCERANKKGAPLATIWAANYFYSHAFCTCCSEAAKGPVLLSLMLALRYSGRNRGSKSTRLAPPGKAITLANDCHVR